MKFDTLKMTVCVDLAHEIDKLRNSMTQKEIAETIGLQQSYISVISRPERSYEMFSMEKLIELGERLGLKFNFELVA